MSINWTKRLVIVSLTTSLSGVGVASAQTWEARDSQLEDRTRGEQRGSADVETVGHRHDDRGKRHGRDHGKHRGWNKKKNKKDKKNKKHRKHRRGRHHRHDHDRH